MKRVLYRDLGRMGYSECWDLQLSLFERMLSWKREGKAQSQENAGELLLVEHDHVYTLGKSGKQQNMLISEEYLRQIGAEFFHIDRGGDITYHGPGQIVGYPILDLEQVGISLRDYIDSIEESIIGVCGQWGIEAGRIAGASGVWIEPDSPRARKICAIGVRASRYVTMHGFAMNVKTDLKYFNHINPCGFVDRGVTSLEKELGHEVDFEMVKSQIVKHLSEKLKIEIYK
ncbi:MAG: lipoyl(octanoyl) transferase LipB [Alistipes sp.]|nr:lipoyl(octanoyl) transferase LipB [Alistipes sp.]MBQ1979910.1 lipoyl(octanoyl) transferase LipB [Alistipes sp.]MBQ2415368.1 lipoyl(octanoyl) transferase LipB [Alistipes sp.]MBQ5785317.1 lipoyl(octanoyl) transferase LipB [Alistipes sp.]MBQ5915354.1 lipoyl(octanoyl) transferase LipB [Alistipes sp.]